MADLSSSVQSSRLSAEDATVATTNSAPTTASPSTAVASSCDALMWEGWNSHPSCSTGDEASTSSMALLPELAPTPSSSASRFHYPSDALCNMLSSFHPLAVHPQTSDDNAGFLHHLEPPDSDAAVAFGELPKSSTYFTGIPYHLTRHNDHIPQWKSSQWQAPQGPHQGLHQGSHQGLHQGLDSREFMRWDSPQWPTIQLFHDDDDGNGNVHLRDVNTFDHVHAQPHSKKLELFSNFGTFADHHSEMISMNNPILVANQTSVSMAPTAWITTSSTTPEHSHTSALESPTARSQQLLSFVRTAQAAQDAALIENSPRKQQRRSGNGSNGGSAAKRAHVAQDEGGAMVWRNRQSTTVNENEDAHAHSVGIPSAGLRRAMDPTSNSCSSSGTFNASGATSSSSAAAQAMELFAMGPALNTNGRPRARRGSATDPQSVYARHRREKINERFKTLQQLVPNGAKVDIVTMLDEAVHYVQFLQHQIKLLKSETSWITATPNTYKGIDLTNQHSQIQGMGSSACGDRSIV